MCHIPKKAIRQRLKIVIRLSLKPRVRYFQAVVMITGPLVEYALLTLVFKSSFSHNRKDEYSEERKAKGERMAMSSMT